MRFSKGRAMTDENEKQFYLQGTDFGKERFSGIDQVTFEWNIAYQCNYRCPYCFFEGKWEEYGKRTIFLPVDQWMDRWRKIYDRYGRASILITGGEPFTYPGFIELIGQLSALHYPINISTNASVGLEDFAKTIDPSRVSVTLSFHPAHAALADVLRKSRMMKQHGFRSEYINWVAYPPELEKMDAYIEEARAWNELLKVIPFIGTCKGVAYPDGYTAEEKKKLGMGAVWEQNVKRAGTKCAAGKLSALIFPDGKVARCGQIGERFLLGNILSDDFKLLDAPMECDAGLCPCLKAILPDQ